MERVGRNKFPRLSCPAPPAFPAAFRRIIYRDVVGMPPRSSAQSARWSARARQVHIATRSPSAGGPRFESVQGAREAHRPATYGQLVTGGERAAHNPTGRRSEYCLCNQHRGRGDGFTRRPYDRRHWRGPVASLRAGHHSAPPGRRIRWGNRANVSGRHINARDRRDPLPQHSPLAASAPHHPAEGQLHLPDMRGHAEGR